MKTHRPRLQTLQPRVKELPPRIQSLSSVKKTLRQRQAETGRTLALNGVAWRRLRDAVLREEPLCRDCQEAGRLTPATEVDHADNDPANNDRTNLVPLCRPCHSQKTRRDYGAKVAHGCDERGYPLDPDHPWNREA